MKTTKYNTEVLHSSPLPTHKKPTTRKKSWAIASTRALWTSQKMVNANLEAVFHRIISCVKTLHLKPGEIYFERDYKKDSTESNLAMHSFMTPHFYIRLDCNYGYDYEVEYDFFNCSYEAEVNKLLKQYPMDKGSKRIEAEPDFSTFYTRTLGYQNPQYVHSFKR